MLQETDAEDGKRLVESVVKRVMQDPEMGLRIARRAAQYSTMQAQHRLSDSHVVPNQLARVDGGPAQRPTIDPLPS